MVGLLVQLAVNTALEPTATVVLLEEIVHWGTPPVADAVKLAVTPQFAVMPAVVKMFPARVPSQPETLANVYPATGVTVKARCSPLLTCCAALGDI